MEWQEIIKYFLSAGFITGLLGYLGKILIEHLFSKDLEKFKHDLLIQSEKTQIRFQKLHSDRSEVIKNIYGNLQNLVHSVNDISSIDRVSEELSNSGIVISDPLFQDVMSEQRIQKLGDYRLVYQRFNESFLPNRIFFEKDAADELDKIHQSSQIIFAFAQTIVSASKYKKQNGLPRLFLDVFDKSKEQIMASRDVVEENFRSLLGVSGE